MFSEHSTIKLGLTKDEVITDQLSFVFSDAVENDNKVLASEEQMNSIRFFMKRLFPGIKVNTVQDRKDFEIILSRHKLNAYAEAILIGDTIYTPKELNHADMLIEVFLHPFVEILYKEKQVFFKAMLEEAKNSFPLLDKQINSFGNSTDNANISQCVKEKELLAKALSRYIRQNMGDNKTIHNTFEYFIYSYINMKKDIFGVKTLPVFKKAVNGNNIVPLDSLTNIQSLYNLAEILNTSGICFDISKGLKWSTLVSSK